MPTSFAPGGAPVVQETDAIVISPLESSANIEIGLLTGCQDRPYAFGLAMALLSKDVYLDIIGSDEEDSSEMHTTPHLRFLNFRGSQKQNIGFAAKLLKLVVYYGRLIRYAAGRAPRIFHILWNNKIEFFDRTLLMLYYKLCGKKVALTAHNVNQGRRDGKDSYVNRLTLRIQYRLCDHIFVHTQKMKDELRQDFGVAERKVTVIRHPINDAFPDTGLTPAEAKKRLGLRENEKTILFFGRIRPYKGIEHLLAAFSFLAAKHEDYRLILAGEPKKGSEEYREEIEQAAKRDFDPQEIILRLQSRSTDLSGDLSVLNTEKRGYTVYQNTRRMVLSEANPFFFKGKAGEGIGGPHVGLDMIWPISIIIRGLTSHDSQEIAGCLKLLQNSHAGTGFMHESFHKDDVNKYSRAWFAWANTLFGEFVLKVYREHPGLLA